MEVLRALGDSKLQLLSDGIRCSRPDERTVAMRYASGFTRAPVTHRRKEVLCP